MHTMRILIALKSGWVKLTNLRIQIFTVVSSILKMVGSFWTIELYLSWAWQIIETKWSIFSSRVSEMKKYQCYWREEKIIMKAVFYFIVNPFGRRNCHSRTWQKKTDTQREFINRFYCYQKEISVKKLQIWKILLRWWTFMQRLLSA